MLILERLELLSVEKGLFFRNVRLFILLVFVFMLKMYLLVLLIWLLVEMVRFDMVEFELRMIWLLFDMLVERIFMNVFCSVEMLFMCLMLFMFLDRLIFWLLFMDSVRIVCLLLLIMVALVSFVFRVFKMFLLVIWMFCVEIDFDVYKVVFVLIVIWLREVLLEVISIDLFSKFVLLVSLLLLMVRLLLLKILFSVLLFCCIIMELLFNVIELEFMLLE